MHRLYPARLWIATCGDAESFFELADQRLRSFRHHVFVNADDERDDARHVANRQVIENLFASQLENICYASNLRFERFALRADVAFLSPLNQAPVVIAS